MDEGHSADAEQERRIRETIRSTAAVRADAAFRERLKREFTSGAIVDSAAPRRKAGRRGLPFWTWFLLPAAVAVVLIVALLLPEPTPKWTVQALRGEGDLEVGGRTVTGSDRADLGKALARGARIVVPQGVSLDLRLDDRMILELSGGADVTLPIPPEADTTGTLTAEVRHGELKIKTGPGFPGTRMHILTIDGRTEIVGTIVSVYKGDGYTCVCVLEGTARVGMDEYSLEEIPQGRLKVMFTDGSPPILEEIAPSHEEGLIEFNERYEHLFHTPD